MNTRIGNLSPAFTRGLSAMTLCVAVVVSASAQQFLASPPARVGSPIFLEEGAANPPGSVPAVASGSPIRAHDGGTNAPANAPAAADETANVFAHPRPFYPYWIGPDFGAGWMHYSTDDVGCANSADCPKFNGGSGWGYLARVVGEWRVTPLWGITARAGYFHASAQLSTTSSTAQTKDAGGNIVPLVRQHVLDVRLPQIPLDVMGSYRFGKAYGLFGLSTGMIVSPWRQATSTLVSPSDVTFGNGSRDTVYLPGSALTNINKLQIGMALGVGYEIPVWNYESVFPELTFSYPFRSVCDDGSCNQLSVQLSLSFRYGLGGSASTK